MNKNKSLAVAVMVALTAAFFALGATGCSERSRLRIALVSDPEKQSKDEKTFFLSADRIYQELAVDFSVNRVDAGALENSSFFKANNFDLLLLPAATPLSRGALITLKNYTFQGGGFLAVLGPSFMAIREELGIKRVGLSDAAGPGLAVSCGLGISPVEPTRGNVFPYRIPVRDFFPFDWLGENSSGSLAGIMIKGWRNPYQATGAAVPGKWCLVRAPTSGGDVQNSTGGESVKRLVRYLAFPAILHDLETGSAAYYPYEEARIGVRAVNAGPGTIQAMVSFEFCDENGKIIERIPRPVALGPFQEKTISFTWKPQTPVGNFCTVRALLSQANIVYDKEENGFVVINHAAWQRGPIFSAEGKNLCIGGKRSLLLGTNYYESKTGELMWARPNMAKVRRDFKQMRALGMNYVRIHYHHSKWFRDYYRQVLQKPLDPYFEETDTTALPSEKSLRIIDAVVQLAQEEGLVISLDLFSLVPVEMGDPVGWLTLKERIVDKDRVAMQKKFIQIVGRRYKDVPGLSWDLWNEPRLAKEDTEVLRAWARELIKTFRDAGDRHLITIGDDMSLELLDVLDYGCIHTYEPSDFKNLAVYRKPVLFQEVWNPAGLGEQEEIRQARELEKDFRAFLSSGAAGFVPWQWTRQARLWDNASEAEKWDNDLGVFANEDGSFRESARIFPSLIKEALQRE